MYRVIDERGSGKTYKLMEYAKNNKAIFVCKHPRAMEEKSHAYGFTGIEFIDYYAFLDHYGKDIGSNYVIDELEMFINYALEFQGISSALLEGYTLSIGD
jgi:hypothetical protein